MFDIFDALQEEMISMLPRQSDPNEEEKAGAMRQVNVEVFRESSGGYLEILDKSNIHTNSDSSKNIKVKRIHLSSDSDTYVANTNYALVVVYVADQTKVNQFNRDNSTNISTGYTAIMNSADLEELKKTISVSD